MWKLEKLSIGCFLCFVVFPKYFAQCFLCVPLSIASKEKTMKSPNSIAYILKNSFHFLPPKNSFLLIYHSVLLLRCDNVYLAFHNRVVKLWPMLEIVCCKEHTWNFLQKNTSLTINLNAYQFLLKIPDHYLEKRHLSISRSILDIQDNVESIDALWELDFAPIVDLVKPQRTSIYKQLGFKRRKINIFK